MPAPREFLGDAHHEPAIHDDAKLWGDREQHLLLHFAEGDEHQPCALLIRGQNPSQFADFFLRGAGQNRIAVKVDEQHRAAPPHQAICGNRRIDPARQQTRHPATGSRRKPAGARLLAEEVERVVRQQVDVHRQLRIAEIDAPTGCVLDAATDLEFDLGRRQRIPFVGTARCHTK